MPETCGLFKCGLYDRFPEPSEEGANTEWGASTYIRVSIHKCIFAAIRFLAGAARVRFARHGGGSQIRSG